MLSFTAKPNFLRQDEDGKLGRTSTSVLFLKFCFKQQQQQVRITCSLVRKVPVDFKNYSLKLNFF